MEAVTKQRDPEDLRQRFESELAGVRDMLLSYVRHLIWAREDLPDALQAILLTAYQRFEDYRPGGNFKAWIFQIATYEVFNRNRKSVKERRTLVPLDDDLSDQTECLDRETSYDALLGDAAALASVLGLELKTAIAKLEVHERAVLLLRIVGGFSTTEASRMLEMPAGSVMGYLGRARRKLRLSLATYAREAGILRTRNGVGPR